MNIPNELLPLLKQITQSEQVNMEFWLDLESEKLNELFFNLSSQLILSELDLNALPVGYKLVTYIFDWESNCLFSGWYALENLGDSIPEIVKSYQLVGLNQEALAISRASDAWDSIEQDHDKVTMAYDNVENTYSDDEERLNYLSHYFKHNAEKIFYI